MNATNTINFDFDIIECLNQSFWLLACCYSNQTFQKKKNEMKWVTFYHDPLNKYKQFLIFYCFAFQNVEMKFIHSIICTMRPRIFLRMVKISTLKIISNFVCGNGYVSWKKNWIQYRLLLFSIRQNLNYLTNGKIN